MIRIAHICEGFVGGLCTHLCIILPRLVARGFDITLIVSLGRSSPDVDARVAELRRSGVEVRIMPMLRGIRPLKDVRSLLAICGVLSHAPFDIVHTHGSKAGALGRVAAVLAGNRIRLHSPHCFAFLRNGRRPVRLAYLGVERLLGPLTTHLITVAPSEARIAARYHIVPPGRCSLVRNALPDGSPPIETPGAGRRQDLNLPSPARSHRTVTTVCRLVDYKGVFRFLRAAQLSQSRYTRFLVAGDGELKEAAQRFVAANHLERRVRLLGYIRNMASIYARSDVVALCSEAEAAPYCLLEAMRARCAIVATAVVGNRELVTHNRTGLLVGPDPTQIARAIDDLLANERKRRDLTDAAYLYFREHHNIEKQISGLCDIYERLYHGEGHCVRHRP